MTSKTPVKYDQDKGESLMKDVSSKTFLEEA